MVETQVSPLLLPQTSMDPVTLGAGDPAVTGVSDGEYAMVWVAASLEMGAALDTCAREACIAPVA